MGKPSWFYASVEVGSSRVPLSICAWVPSYHPQGSL